MLSSCPTNKRQPGGTLNQTRSGQGQVSRLLTLSMRFKGMEDGDRQIKATWLRLTVGSPLSGMRHAHPVLNAEAMGTVDTADFAVVHGGNINTDKQKSRSCS